MYVKRHLALPHDHSVLLFGARGVGKSSLLEDEFKLDQNLYLDLLDPEIEMRFLEKPNDLIALVDALPNSATHVIIDEIQKAPKLLDVVHLLIEKKKTKKIFILTGSSARKLKLAGVNLLAGRAFVYHLYPLTYLELGSHFKLTDALSWGLLPKAVNLTTATANLRTESDVEVDLIVERPGEKLLLIEIKSKKCVDQSDLKSLNNIASDFEKCEAVCF